MRRVLVAILLLTLSLGAWGQPGASSQDFGVLTHVLFAPGNDPSSFVLNVSASTGTYTLSVTAGSVTRTTAGIGYLATAVQVQAAVAALSNVGTGKITVSGPPGGTYVLSFATSLGSVSITSNASGLTGGSATATLSGFAGSHVDHGLFHTQGTGGSLGTAFTWESWAAPYTGNYLVSFGYGGNHGLLWGFNGSSSTPGTMTGNVYTGSGATSFQGTYAPLPGEWGHWMVAWNGSKITTWANGICDGQTTFTGPRQADNATIGGRLFVLGSDHLNLKAKIAYLAGWDRSYWSGSLSAMGPYFPSRFPRRYNASTGIWADFVAAYWKPGIEITDLSTRGYSPDGTNYYLHPGIIAMDGDASRIAQPGTFSPYNDTPGVPKWILDTSCPFGQAYGSSPAPPGNFHAPATVPAGCLQFDSFGRANQTPAFQMHPTLGSTEGGTLGAKVWEEFEPDSFGILGGAAVITRSTATGRVVDLGTADQTITVQPGLSTYDSGATGIVYRAIDKNNYREAFTLDKADIFDFNVVNGVPSSMHQFHVTTGTSWSTLKVQAVGNTITLWVDGNADPSPITSSVLNTATKAGIGTGYAESSTYVSSLARFRNWTAWAGAH